MKIVGREVKTARQVHQHEAAARLAQGAVGVFHAQLKVPFLKVVACHLNRS
jgi:hypothetical protein